MFYSESIFAFEVVTIGSRCRKWSDLIGENAVGYIAVESASAGDWALHDDMSYDVMLVVDLRGITVKVRLDSEEKFEDCAKDDVGVGRTIEEIESKVVRENEVVHVTEKIVEDICCGAIQARGVYSIKG